MVRAETAIFGRPKPSLMSTVTPADLRTLPSLADLDDEFLQWIIDNSTYKEYEDGDLILKTGEPADYMMIPFEGAFDLYMPQNGKYVFVRSWNNEITGLLPFSRMTHAPGNAYSVGKSKAISLSRSWKEDRPCLPLAW
jgi:CRP-like cAMP-binding protein